MTTADQNFQLLQEIEANRLFLLMSYEQNPKLLENAEPRIKEQLDESVSQDKISPIRKPLDRQCGISLIELIMFIVIISVALTGILLVMNQVTRHSADPLIHKQALSIAESLLEEVELMPFSYCDPDDASAVTATSATVGGTGCAATVENIGPETISGVTETRLGGAGVNAQLDNVNDYAGLTLPSPILDITGSGGAPAGYSASIAVVTAALNGLAGTDVNGAPQVLRITVTVTGPDNLPIVLDGYRTRYSPRI